MRVVPDPYLENPYPQSVDDGRWEDDGGYVARPSHQMWMMQVPKLRMNFFRHVSEHSSEAETICIMHPLTYAEYEHALKKVK